MPRHEGTELLQIGAPPTALQIHYTGCLPEAAVRVRSSGAPSQRIGVTSGADMRWKNKPAASFPVTTTRNASVPGVNRDR